jgi:hypothetical protein
LATLFGEDYSEIISPPDSGEDSWSNGLDNFYELFDSIPRQHSEWEEDGIKYSVDIYYEYCIFSLLRINPEPENETSSYEHYTLLWLLLHR